MKTFCRDSRSVSQQQRYVPAVNEYFQMIAHEMVSDVSRKSGPEWALSRVPDDELRTGVIFDDPRTRLQLTLNVSCLVLIFVSCI